MLDVAVLDALLEAGCTAEQIVAAVKADIAKEEERKAEKRAKDAERQRNHRSKNKPKSRDVTVTNSDKCDPPNDIYSNPPVSPSSANADDTPPFEIRLVEKWNAAGKLRQARKLTGQRLAKARRRLKEFGEDALFDGIDRLAASAFHTGKNDREWVADIGWYLRSDDNVTKALELPKSETTQPAKPRDPGDWLAHCEAQGKKWRELGQPALAGEWDERARIARAKLIPKLKVVQ